MPYTINFKENKMSFSDVEHVMTMMSGCESLLHGDPKSADAQYAFTVLKLHANDAGFVAGQEGFLDAVKKGASATVEWVKKLIRAIRDYIKGISKEDRERINQIKKRVEELSKVEEFNPSTVFSGLLDPAKILQQRLELIEKDLSGVDFDFIDVKTAQDKAEELVKFMESGESFKIGEKLESLRSSLDNILTEGTASLEKRINAKPSDDKKLTDGEKFASTALKNITNTKEATSRLINKTVEALSKEHTRFNNKQDDRNSERDRLNREKDMLEKKK